MMEQGFNPGWVQIQDFDSHVSLPSFQGLEGLLYSSKWKSCQLEGNWHLSSTWCWAPTQCLLWLLPWRPVPSHYLWSLCIILTSSSTWPICFGRIYTKTSVLLTPHSCFCWSGTGPRASVCSYISSSQHSWGGPVSPTLQMRTLRFSASEWMTDLNADCASV